MAYTVPTSSIMEVTCELQHNLQTVMSVFHFKLTSGGSITDGSAALLAMSNAMQAGGGLWLNWVSAISDDLSNGMIYCQWIFPTRYSLRSFVPAVASGQVAITSFPQNLAVSITKMSDFGTRRGRGTLHMPGVPNTWVDGGELSAAGLAGYVAIRDDLNDTVVLATGHTLTPVIYNRSAPGDSITITDALLQPTSRVMRRRTVGVGI